MLLETCDRFHVKIYEASDFLKNHPRLIKKLSNHRKALDLVHRLPHLTICEVAIPIVRHSHVLIGKYQLLSSDALHVATCLANNIKHVATNDNDFKRVKTLTVWSP